MPFGGFSLVTDRTHAAIVRSADRIMYSRIIHETTDNRDNYPLNEWLRNTDWWVDVHLISSDTKRVVHRLTTSHHFDANATRIRFNWPNWNVSRNLFIPAAVAPASHLMQCKGKTINAHRTMWIDCVAISTIFHQNNLFILTFIPESIEIFRSKKTITASNWRQLVLNRKFSLPFKKPEN